MDKITQFLTSKIIGYLLMAALTVTFALGTAAFNDNTAQMGDYAKTMKSYTESNDSLAKDIGEVKLLVGEVRKSSFDDKLRNLTKQIYKIQNDPEDIKEVDVAAASDFCDSSLFDDYIMTLSGSERVVILSSCQEANVWVKENTT